MAAFDAAASLTAEEGRRLAAARYRRVRLWAGRLAVAVLAPLIILGASEAVLRLVGSGYPTRFFVDVGDGEHLTGNDRFAWRFFSPELARNPTELYISRRPPDGTIRVFVLGGSAAMGTPEPAFGLARMLEVHLEMLYPQHRFEVHNTAMAAINSHVVRLIAAECARLEPDLLVVLLGNNEVVGPYGPGTVFAGYQPSTSLVRLSLWARSLRLGQLMEGAASSLARGQDAPASWRGLEMFLGHAVAATDPRLDSMAANLGHNLRAIVRKAQSSGAPVLLGTMPVNLKDSAPFSSSHRPETSDSERQQMAHDLAMATSVDSPLNDALAAAEHAVSIDDQHAEAHFQYGRLLAASGRMEDARTELSLARDTDTLRFRADSRVNATIRRVANSEPNATLVDGVAELAAAPETVARLLGGELFWEHVHLRFIGTHRLAAAFANAAGHALSLPPQGATPDVETCRRRLALTSWDTHQMVATIWQMTRRAPFTAQSNHHARTRSLGRQLAAARAGQDLEKAHSILIEAVERSPDDVPLRARLARFLQATGQLEDAIEQWRRLLDLVPDQIAWRTQLGFARLDSGQTTAAIRELERVVHDRPRRPSAHVNLGIVLQAAGRTSDAREAFATALALAPTSTAARLNLGALETANGQLDEAESTYREVVTTDPRSAEGHLRLGEVLRARGRPDEAEAAFRTAFELDPADPRPAAAAARILAEDGRIDTAIALLESAIEMAPGATTALAQLGELRLATGDALGARQAFRAALAQAPRFASPRINLAVAQQLLGQPGAAIETYTTLLEHHPDHVHGRLGLGWLLVTTRDPALRDPGRARQLLDEALERVGDDLNARVSAATLATALGDTGRARQILTTALDQANAMNDERALAAISERLAALSNGT
jgi:tetratricopeptide (TPR) repeat protein